MPDFERNFDCTNLTFTFTDHTCTPYNDISVTRMPYTSLSDLLLIGTKEPIKAERVIFNEPATIVLWSDKTKTVVKCDPNDQYDRMKGVALCYMKKFLGNTSRELNKALRSSGAYEETNKESEEE